MNIIEQISKSLIVSCQAWPNSPLYGPMYMTVMAEAAAVGGAAGLRINGNLDILAVRQRVKLPIIGIHKYFDEAGELWITPGFEEAVAIAQAGAEIIAIDGMHQNRTGGMNLGQLIHRIHTELGLIVLVDVSTYEEGCLGADLGADMVATTLSILRQELDTPDYGLLSRLVDHLPIPVVAEGLFWTPEEVCHALDLGAHAVVVGTAITRPDDITRRFIKAIQARQCKIDYSNR